MLFPSILAICALVVNVTQAKVAAIEEVYGSKLCGFFDDEKLKDKGKEGYGQELKSLCTVDHPVIFDHGSFSPTQRRELEFLWAEATQYGRMMLDVEPRHLCAKNRKFCISWTQVGYFTWDNGDPTGVASKVLQQAIICAQHGMASHHKFVVDDNHDVAVCVGSSTDCSLDTEDDNCAPMSSMCHLRGMC